MEELERRFIRADGFACEDLFNYPEYFGSYQNLDFAKKIFTIWIDFRDELSEQTVAIHLRNYTKSMVIQLISDLWAIAGNSVVSVTIWDDMYEVRYFIPSTGVTGH